MIVLLCLAGGAGAIVRHVLDTGLTRILPETARPLSILFVNIVGSAAVGLVAGSSDAAEVVLGTGFLGSFTTFSTAFVDVWRLLLASRRTAAVLYAAGTLLLSTLAAAAGFAVGGN